MIKFEEYLNDLPKLHSWDGGKHWSTGGFQAHHLRRIHDFLKNYLPDRPQLLETGAGNSTISFLFLRPGHLISIAPDGALFKRIKQYCHDHDIDATMLDAQVECSQWVLPSLALARRVQGPFLDFVLIDGCHGWPTAFVDLEYGHAMLKKGGYLMIDDVDLHAIKEMARFLVRQPGFELVLDIGKSLIFRKNTDARDFGEWDKQPYILDHTEKYRRLANPFSLKPYSAAGALRGACWNRLRELAYRFGYRGKA